MYILLLLIPQTLAGTYASVPASAPLYAANPNYVRTIYVSQVPSAPVAQPLAQPVQYNRPTVIYTIPQASPTTYASSGLASPYQQANVFPSPSDGAEFIRPQYFKPNARGYYKLRVGSPVYSGCREYLSDPCNCPPSCRPYVQQYSASSCGGFGGQQDRGYGGSRYGAGGGGGGAYGYGDSGPWENGWDVLDPQGGHYHHHHKHHQKAFNFEEDEGDDDDDRITVKPRTHKTHHEESPDEDLWDEDEHKSSNKEEIDSFMDSGETREFVKTRLGESGGHSPAPSPSFGSGGLGGGGSPGFGGGGGNPGGIGIGGGVNAAGVGVNTGLGISAPGIGTAGPVPGSGGGMGGGGLGGGLGNGGLFGISSGIGVGIPGVGPIGVSSGLGIGK